MLLLAILVFTLARTFASPIPGPTAGDSAPNAIDNFLSILSSTFNPIIYGFPLSTPTVVHGLAVVTGSGADGRCIQSLRPRTPLTIIWNCFATIAACTFFAMHPNMPNTTAKWYKKHWKRFLITLDALLRPEAVIFWAMRQLIVAIRIQQNYKGAKWTLSHGFFVQMGGLVLVDEGDENKAKVVTIDGNGMVYVGRSRVPSIPKIELDRSIHVVEHGAEVPGNPHRPMDLKFIIPCITYDELQDKAKGDFLSKVFAITQTSWFILQCIARRERELAVTELELVTSAYALLNVVMYGLWWSKPRNAVYPIYFNRKGHRVAPPEPACDDPPPSEEDDKVKEEGSETETTPESPSKSEPKKSKTKKKSKSKPDTEPPEQASAPLSDSTPEKQVEPGEKAEGGKVQEKNNADGHPEDTQTIAGVPVAVVEQALWEVQQGRKFRMKDFIKGCLIIIFYPAILLLFGVFIVVVFSLAGGGIAVILALLGLFALSILLVTFILASLIAIPLYVFKTGNYLKMMRKDRPSKRGWVGNHYAGKLSDKDASKTRMIMYSILPCICGMAFGAIHLLAWNFEFASEQERLLWRIASVFVTVEPFWMAFVEGTIRSILERAHRETKKKAYEITVPLVWKWRFARISIFAKIRGTIFAFASLIPPSILSIFYLIFYFRPLLYGMIRVYIVVQALLALRHLSSSALESVDWSTFLPHF